MNVRIMLECISREHKMNNYGDSVFRYKMLRCRWQLWLALCYGFRQQAEIAEFCPRKAKVPRNWTTSIRRFFDILLQGIHSCSQLGRSILPVKHRDPQWRISARRTRPAGVHTLALEMSHFAKLASQVAGPAVRYVYNVNWRILVDKDSDASVIDFTGITIGDYSCSFDTTY